MYDQIFTIKLLFSVGHTARITSLNNQNTIVKEFDIGNIKIHISNIVKHNTPIPIFRKFLVVFVYHWLRFTEAFT